MKALFTSTFGTLFYANLTFAAVRPIESLRTPVQSIGVNYEDRLSAINRNVLTVTFYLQ